MNRYLAILRVGLHFIIVISILMSGWATFAETESSPTTDQANNDINLVVVIPIEQTIESGLKRFLERALEEAHDIRADYIILEVNTLGGEVNAASDIGKLIRSSSIPTVAFVRGKAISAGSYISLNANQILMGPGSSIGAAAVVDLAGTQVEDPKVLAYWIGEMTSAAEINGRNPQYAVGMVDARKEITVEELGKTYPPGELISFTAEEAVAAGYAEGIASNISDVLAHLGAEQAHVETIELSAAEKLARFLTNPIVRTLLLLIGIAGIGIELFVPGFGFPGILGIASIVTYFAGQYVAGFAGVEHILMFVAGIVLLVIEIFVPSFGIFAVLGIIGLFSGIILAAYDTGDAIRSLLIALVCSIIVIVVIAKIFQKRGVWNKFILSDQLTTEEGYIPHTSKDELLGKKGVAVTPLRPSGTAMIEDERVDVVTNGEYIQAGVPVIVQKVEGTRVVVRKESSEEEKF